MRLKKIKLAGFKSFVDPTVLELKSSLVAVVGPNGCGKSNIIDAVRWVMGESSAKHLRGESMTDVIFNGSTTRKPVGLATVELLFDNTDGSLGGEYASYSEISVRRQVTRDAQVTYYLNGSKCRRKDITDIFLGTGLGPRSYAIIEQGMISRVIDAKPEDLRAFLEEAAGVALYKKRRQETETRMRHTRENLERLSDILSEQEKQIEKLKRQSEAAIRYNAYQQEIGSLDANLTAYRCRILTEQKNILMKNLRLFNNNNEGKITERGSIDLSLEKHRLEYIQQQDIFNGIQSQFFDVGAKIARCEQTIQHHRERERQIQEDLIVLQSQIDDTAKQIQKDKAHQEDSTLFYAKLEPELELLTLQNEETQMALDEASEKFQIWQEAWDEFQQLAQNNQRMAEVESARIEQYDKQIRTLELKRTKLMGEHTIINPGEIKESIDSLNETSVHKMMEIECQQIAIDALQDVIFEEQDQYQIKSKILHTVLNELQTLKGHTASLETLQAAALNTDHDTSLKNWLTNHEVVGTYLGSELVVEKGWEQAIEFVLSENLSMMCTKTDFQTLNLLNGALPDNLQIISTIRPLSHSETKPNGRLISNKIQGPEFISPLIQNIYYADNLQEALEQRQNLESFESVITANGTWLGVNWLKTINKQDVQFGLIAREDELKSCRLKIVECEERIETLQAEIEAILEYKQQHELELNLKQKVLAKLNQESNELNSKKHHQQTRLEHCLLRQKAVVEELNETEIMLQQALEESKAARLKLEDSLDKMEQDTEEKNKLLIEKEQRKREVQDLQIKVKEQQTCIHSEQLKVQKIQAEIKALEAAIARLEAQAHKSLEAKSKLLLQLEHSNDPLTDAQFTLEVLLESRLIIEENLTAARITLESLDQSKQSLETRRVWLEREINEVRTQLEAIKLELQALDIRHENLEIKINASLFSLDELISLLPVIVDEAAWELELSQLQQKIEKLGAINLAAIDEYHAELERKEYLSLQCKDLTDALTVLENAIQKIDKETRTCFKDTFDKVNAGFQSLFPKLFGGGQAYLALTNDDLLEAGVTVMARPPGKRNSSIHLLSGGEKALTAVSLVFSIFRLNPAPFCMLDEVDAPLDDANVGRFCELVKYMAESVQFIFITHNKLAMEMAKHLTGVTMKEPGVSRLVTVDVEEAAALVLN